MIPMIPRTTRTPPTIRQALRQPLPDWAGWGFQAPGGGAPGVPGAGPQPPGWGGGAPHWPEGGTEGWPGAGGAPQPPAAGGGGVAGTSHCGGWTVPGADGGTEPQPAGACGTGAGGGAAAGAAGRRGAGTPGSRDRGLVRCGGSDRSAGGPVARRGWQAGSGYGVRLSRRLDELRRPGLESGRGSSGSGRGSPPGVSLDIEPSRVLMRRERHSRGWTGLAPRPRHPVRGEPCCPPPGDGDLVYNPPPWQGSSVAEQAAHNR